MVKEPLEEQSIEDPFAPPPAATLPLRRDRGLSLRLLLFAIAAFGILSWMIAPVMRASSMTPAKVLAVGMLTLILILIPIVSLAVAWAELQRRRAQQDGLLGLVAVASMRGMPLGPAVATYAERCTSGLAMRAALWIWAAIFAVALVLSLGSATIPIPVKFVRFALLLVVGGIAGYGTHRRWGDLRGRLHDVSLELEQGKSFADALALHPGSLDTRDQVLLRAGEEAGRLSEATEFAVKARTFRREVRSLWIGPVAYVVFLASILYSSTGWLFYYIIPKFERIMEDFGSDYVLSLSAWEPIIWVLRYATPYLAPLMTWAVITVALLATGVLRSFPFWDRVARQPDRSLIFRALAMAVAGSRPIPAAIQSLVRWHPKRWVRRSMIGIYHDVHEGVDEIHALKRAGWARPAEAAALEAAGRLGNRDWVFRELAELGERQDAARVRLITNVGFTLAMLALGVGVAFGALAAFLPLVELIWELAQ